MINIWDFLKHILTNELVHIAPTGLSIGILVYIYFLDRRINDFKERIRNLENKIERFETIILDIITSRKNG
ncbi:MAG: hypothetical protein LWW95_08425 [Candidatus Desulfofervidus auxilii]|nr:hypothetical protein [Candidatus Desulfofervidus auxilii]